jgi:hypothetical protein
MIPLADMKIWVPSISTAQLDCSVSCDKNLFLTRVDVLRTWNNNSTNEASAVEADVHYYHQPNYTKQFYGRP